MLYTKYQSFGPFSIGQEDFWKSHFENLFLTSSPTYKTNPNRLNNLVGGHSGIIPVKCIQNPISGSGEEVVWSFSNIIQCKIVTPGAVSILTPGA